MFQLSSLRKKLARLDARQHEINREYKKQWGLVSRLDPLTGPKSEAGKGNLQSFLKERWYNMALQISRIEKLHHDSLDNKKIVDAGGARFR